MSNERYSHEFVTGRVPLGISYELLSYGQVRRHFEMVKNNFFDQGKVKAKFQHSAIRNDIATATDQEFSQLIGKLPVDGDADVIVLWCRQDAGIRIKWGLFAEHASSFWYPSSDDVWVSNMEMSWLLEIDHEEIMTFFSLPRD